MITGGSTVSSANIPWPLASKATERVTYQGDYSTQVGPLPLLADIGLVHAEGHEGRRQRAGYRCRDRRDGGSVPYRLVAQRRRGIPRGYL